MIRRLSGAGYRRRLRCITTSLDCLTADGIPKQQAVPVSGRWLGSPPTRAPFSALADNRAFEFTVSQVQTEKVKEGPAHSSSICSDTPPWVFFVATAAAEAGAAAGTAAAAAPAPPHLNRAFNLEPDGGDSSPLTPSALNKHRAHAAAAMQQIIAHAIAGDAEGALATYRRCRAARLVPTRDFFQLLMGLCTRCAHPGGAREVVDDFARSGGAPSEPTWRLLVLLALEGMYGGAGREPLSVAMDVLAALDAVGTAQRYRTYAPVVEALAARDDVAGLQLASTQRVARAYLTSAAVIDSCTVYSTPTAVIVSCSLYSTSAAVTDICTFLRVQHRRCTSLSPAATDRCAALRTQCRRRSQALWARMAQRGVAPQERFFVALAGACARRSADEGLDSALAGLAKCVEYPSTGAVKQLIELLGERAVHTSVGRDGRCQCCGGRLQRIGLTAAQRRRLRNRVMLLAAQAGAPKALALADFAAHVGAMRPPPTAILDGPNIAYHGQNYSQGAFSFEQVDAVVRHLEASGERPLIVLPAHYAQPRIPTHVFQRLRRRAGHGEVGGRTAAVTEAQRALVQRWRDAGILYECPRRALDDWLWMYATAALEPAEGGAAGGGGGGGAAAAAARGGAAAASHSGGGGGGAAAAAADVNESQAAAAASGGPAAAQRGPQQEASAAAAAAAPRVITNDRMRDHVAGLALPSRHLARWRATQMSGFSVGYALGEGSTPVVVAALTQRTRRGQRQRQQRSNDGEDGDFDEEEESEEEGEGEGEGGERGGEGGEPLVVRVDPLPAFSWEMQGVEGEGGGRCWHVPLGPRRQGAEWLCIRVHSGTGSGGGGAA
ncbi:hypothetical protein JKP88DRAFT_266877 [Tribonema minus]|uniref:Uncharacterized protein n=1 Tax=Tribonema minus TaxID=303371 RepID=A0A836CLC4_9STRA|nr:hypothetical protein JKP88DRAFT_266877 [Tribonema minus]